MVKRERNDLNFSKEFVRRKKGKKVVWEFGNEIRSSNNRYEISR